MLIGIWSEQKKNKIYYPHQRIRKLFCKFDNKECSTIVDIELEKKSKNKKKII